MSTCHVALVTGGSRGIGRAVARRIARGGAAVIVAARGVEACRAVCSEIEGEGGIAWPLAVDLGAADGLDAAVARARVLTESVGPIDWLVNNAGIAFSAPFLRHGRGGDGDLYARHMDLNFHAPRCLIETLAPDMLTRKYGRIVNVASSAGLRGYAYVAAYCASKHALVGYSRSAALELTETGVTMNLVCPHYVDSPMTDVAVERIVKKTGRSAADARALLAAQNPGGTFVSTEEVAEVVFALLDGDQNGALAELVGGDGSMRETVSWS
jgi:NAD(P)-dependent dehydrogenase (short-subunit alcohol dehydrogenase family)